MKNAHDEIIIEKDTHNYHLEILETKLRETEEIACIADEKGDTKNWEIHIQIAVGIRFAIQTIEEAYQYYGE